MFSKLSESNNLKLSLIGKDSDSNTLISSNKTSLNHVALDGNVNWNQIGIILANKVLSFRYNSHYVTLSEISGTFIKLKITISSMNKYYDNESFWKFGEWQLTAEKCGSIQPSAQDCHDSITISSSHPSYSGDTNNRPKLGSSTRIINRSFIESVINFEISSDNNN